MHANGYTENNTMDNKDFCLQAHQLVDWIENYFKTLADRPVKSPLKPGEVLAQLPESPPQYPVDFDACFKAFESSILPGITHWQHPKFFAYFPANSSYPSILAEMLTSSLAVQCMSWQTSPAASELEQRVCEWLLKMMQLPSSWHGCIQSTASEATFTSLLSAIGHKSQYKNIEQGLKDCPTYTVYCSKEAHSSVEKAVKLSGLGLAQLRLIDTDAQLAMDVESLAKCIENDVNQGFSPLWLTACLGTTGTTAIDPLASIAKLCKRHGIWMHIDAAYAGSALICPEFRQQFESIVEADSLVFNPHKWLLTNFDCSIYFIKNKEALLNTFAMTPPYLKTDEDDEVNNYRDWGIPLGRRFRALKLWFVFCCYGVQGLQAFIRNHCQLAKTLQQKIDADPAFERLAPVPFNLICFRYKPARISDIDTLNALNKALMDALNASGKMYLTHTLIDDRFVLRLCIGAVSVTQTHLDEAWEQIKQQAFALADPN